MGIVSGECRARGLSRKDIGMAVLDVCHGVLMAMNISLPPPEFDHPYTDGTLTVSIMDVRDIQKECSSDVKILGSIYPCAVALPEAHACRIVLPKVEIGIITQMQQDRLRRHEIGHCNGWLAGHAGAVSDYHLVCTM
jgi:hypothetical protein